MCARARACDTQAAAKVQGNNTSCPCAVSQYAGVAALTKVDATFGKEQLVNFRRKRDFVVQRLRSMPGVFCPVPQGKASVSKYQLTYPGLAHLCAVPKGSWMIVLRNHISRHV
eukprot:6204154-Pleurochrysis_carterae.AAC.2